MLGLDHWLAGLGHGGGLTIAMVVAVLLGLRHATDPDHLTAVSTLIASDERRGPRRARALGLAWGLGHAVTLVALGLPVVLLGSSIPQAVQTLAETAVGLVIVVLAARLLVRWRRGYFHVHPHDHAGIRHSHPHVHERSRAPREGPHEHEARHEHTHAEAGLGRSPRAALGIGMAHGVGGSAGVGILLVGGIGGRAAAVIALLLFAFATAASMAVVSSVLGDALARGPVARRLRQVVPALGVASLLFGAWYTLGALAMLPYPVA